MFHFPYSHTLYPTIYSSSIYLCFIAFYFLFSSFFFSFHLFFLFFLFIIYVVPDIEAPETALEGIARDTREGHHLINHFVLVDFSCIILISSIIVCTTST